jgi:hypothetical protein
MAIRHDILILIYRSILDYTSKITLITGITNTIFSLYSDLLVYLRHFIPVRNNDPEGNKNKDRPCIWILIYPIRLRFNQKRRLFFFRKMRRILIFVIIFFSK